MRISYLKEFLCLARNLSFHNTAEELYISDSSLSRHIAALEKELDIQLLYRNTHSVELTPIAQEFYLKMQNVIQQYDNVMDEIKMKASGYLQTLKIGVPYYAMSDYLGTAPVAFSQTKPDILLNYYMSNPREIMRALTANEVDAVITAKMPIETEDDFVYHTLFHEPFIVFMSSRNPLAGKKELLASDIQDQVLLNVDTPYYDKMWELLKSMFSRKQIELKEPMKYHQIESVFNACQNNEGVTISGWHMRRQASSSLRYVPLKEPSFTREVCLVRKKAFCHPEIPGFLKAYSGIGRFGWPDTAPEWAESVNTKEV